MCRTTGFRCGSCSRVGDVRGLSREARPIDESLAFESLEDDRFVCARCAREDSEDGIEKVMRGEDDNGPLMLSRLVRIYAIWSYR
jgi:hypothetical protein